jgi:thiosulfate/3-mercaptopyruvate sulfurtransferase
MTQGSPIISPETLRARLGAPDLRIVDIRWVLGSPGAGRIGYENGHIPDAVFLDLDTELAAATGPGRHPLPEPADLTERLETVGIGDADDVVVYDDVGGWVAARLWWMLDDLGHQRIRVLDGGLPAWLAAGFPTTTADPRPRPRGSLHLHAGWTNVIDREDVVAGLGRIVLLDARGGPRYRGEVEPIDPVAGHIPTARNAPADTNVGPDGRLLSQAALAERFGALGVTAASPVVTSCGSGVTACFTSLAMRVAGLPDPILYPGSYSDWSRAGLPIAIGPEPGEPPAPHPTTG